MLLSNRHPGERDEAHRVPPPPAPILYPLLCKVGVLLFAIENCYAPASLLPGAPDSLAQISMTKNLVS